jgi:hypothetical protein
MSSSTYQFLTFTSDINKYLFAEEEMKNKIKEFILKKNPKLAHQDLAFANYFDLNDSVLPTLNSIEKTHNTLINSTFKPSIKMVSEYIKVSHTSPKFGTTIQYQIPKVANFISDMVFHIKLKGLSAVDPRDRVRYVSMLGHRLIKKVQFTVNSHHVIDEYGTEDYNAYFQHELPTSKRDGWLRCVGQESPKLGCLTADPKFDMFNEYKWVGDGNQTLKHTHDEIDLFIPLLFWFKELKNALPIGILPWGQIQIKLELSEVSDIVGFADYGGGGKYNSPTIEFSNLYVNNIFTSPEFFNIYAKKFKVSMIRLHLTQKKLIKYKGDEAEELLLNNMKWNLESLYFSFRPVENMDLSQYWHKNAFLAKKSYMVPVLARDETTVITGTIVSAKINSAIITSGAAVLSNDDNFYNGYYFIITSGSGYYRDIIRNRYIVKSYNGTTKEVVLTTDWDESTPNFTTEFELFTPQLATNMVNYYIEKPIVSKIGFNGQGIPLTFIDNELFYNAYSSLKYKNVITPSDRGSYSIHFNMQPLEHDPSSSFDVSSAKEFYINYTLNAYVKDKIIELTILGKTLNFIIIDDNSGTLALLYT